MTYLRIQERSLGIPVFPARWKRPGLCFEALRERHIVIYRSYSLAPWVTHGTLFARQWVRASGGFAGGVPWVPFGLGLVSRQCPMAKKNGLDTMSNPLFYLVALQGLEPRTRGL